MKDIATSQENGKGLVKAGKAFSYTSNMKPGFTRNRKRTCIGKGNGCGTFDEASVNIRFDHSLYDVYY